MRGLGFQHQSVTGIQVARRDINSPGISSSVGKAAPETKGIFRRDVSGMGYGKEKRMQKQAEGVMHRKRLKGTRVDIGMQLSTHTLPDAETLRM